MNILTVDLEEWFHIDFDQAFLKKVSDLDEYESRISENLNILLTLFDKHQVKATFFCLGSIAKKYPNLIKQIHSRGHDIGCHSNKHILIDDLSPDEFNEDTKEALEIISNITGEKVKSYRAPCFSITESCSWAFDILVENGIEIDCSVFPTNWGF